LYFPPDASFPTYGQLIDIFTSNSPDEESAFSDFQTEFPEFPVGRKDRFLESVQRIVAPIKPSMIGDSKLIGSHLQSYRKRIWQPRIRNPKGSASGVMIYYINPHEIGLDFLLA